MEEIIFDLDNIDNYNDNIQPSDIKQIVENYIIILNQYLYNFVNILSFGKEEANSPKNNKHELIKIKNKMNYIKTIISGMNLCYRIYLNVLLSTKNIELTKHHTQKSYLYFTEFIQQINNNDVEYINLNTHDAIMFCYRKTIFKCKENMDNNKTKKSKNIINIIEKMTFIYSIIVKIVCILNEYINIEECESLHLLFQTNISKSVNLFNKLTNYNFKDCEDESIKTHESTNNVIIDELMKICDTINNNNKDNNTTDIDELFTNLEIKYNLHNIYSCLYGDDKD